MKYYNENVTEDLEHIIKGKYFGDWLDMVEGILLNKEFQKRKLFRHHKGNLWQHLTEVSYYSFLMAKTRNADERVCAIAGLLHDFYPKAYKFSQELYDENPEYLTDVKKKQPIHQMHGFTHAEAAAKNAWKYFPEYMDDKIDSCIKTHMFPLNIKPPRYKEGWILTYVDKKLSIGVINKINNLLNMKEK